MSDSKKEFEIMGKLIMDVVSGLSDTEFNNLLRGKGTLRYVERDLAPSIIQGYEMILINLIELLPQRLEAQDFLVKKLGDKQSISDFGRFLKVEIKSKDTINSISLKIIEHVENEKETILYSLNKKKDLTDVIGDIARKLEKFVDIDQALNYLKANDDILNKDSLMKLARKMDVHLDKDTNSQDAINLIVDSVVGSKIRSLSIRKKLYNSNVE